MEEPTESAVQVASQSSKQKIPVIYEDVTPSVCMSSATNPTNNAVVGDRGGTPSPTSTGLFALQLPTPSIYPANGSPRLLIIIMFMQ